MSKKSKGIPSSWDADMVRSHVWETMRILDWSVREYAHRVPMDHTHLQRFLNGERDLAPTKLLDSIGMKAVVYYEHK